MGLLHKKVVGVGEAIGMKGGRRSESEEEGGGDEADAASAGSGSEAKEYEPTADSDKGKGDSDPGRMSIQSKSDSDASNPILARSGNLSNGYATDWNTLRSGLVMYM